MSAPKATAMGKPIIPVPGIPTPMAFFSMLALSHTVIFSGLWQRFSVALAVQRATAIGSVQPTAGTTSFCISARILASMVGSIMAVLLYEHFINVRQG